MYNNPHQLASYILEMHNGIPKHALVTLNEMLNLAFGNMVIKEAIQIVKSNNNLSFKDAKHLMKKGYKLTNVKQKDVYFTMQDEDDSFVYRHYKDGKHDVYMESHFVYEEEIDKKKNWLLTL